MNERFAHGQLPGSLELAFLGDTVYDFYVRRALVLEGGKVKDLHRRAVAVVCARAQAQALYRVESLLTEEEQDVVRRARNCHSNPPKHADAGEYHRATALEALIGYLTLTDQTARLNQILQAALNTDE
jgi:ribonuclease-3 family protein